jgi:O-Antigen ligase
MQTAVTTRPSRGALVLAFSLFLIFRHASYDPSVGIPVGSTSVDIGMADLGVLLTVGAACAELRNGRRLPTGRRIWVLRCGAGLCAWMVIATLYGPLVSSSYPLAASFASVATFVEYALLALAAAVLVRTRSDMYAVVGAFVLLAAAAALWGALQFLGLVNEFEGRRPLQREVSFLGNHDFAAVGGATLGVAFAILATGLSGRWRLVGWVAAVAGVVGVVLGAAITTVAAVMLSALVALLVGWRRHLIDRRRGAAIVLLTCITIAGSVSLRSGDIGHFFRFLGVGANEHQETNLETGSHRAVLSYIGLRIFLDHPLLGVGWQGTLLEENYGPYLDDARQRFPEVAPGSLPSPEHPWGIQNAYVQASADLGIVGLVLLLATVLGAIAVAAAAAIRGPPETSGFALLTLFALLVGSAEFAALGLIPGIPTTALLWLAIGGAVALPRDGALPDDAPDRA